MLIARETVELGDDQHGPRQAAGVERAGELGAVVVLAGFHLGELFGQRSAAPARNARTASRCASSPRPLRPCPAVETR